MAKSSASENVDIACYATRMLANKYSRLTESQCVFHCGPVVDSKSFARATRVRFPGLTAKSFYAAKYKSLCQCPERRLQICILQPTTTWYNPCLFACTQKPFYGYPEISHMDVFSGVPATADGAINVVLMPTAQCPSLHTSTAPHTGLAPINSTQVDRAPNIVNVHIPQCHKHYVTRVTWFL